MTNTTNPCPDVPRPAGAHHIGERCVDCGAARRFEATMRGTCVRVDIQGEQSRDGATDRYIVMYGNDFLDAATIYRPRTESHTRRRLKPPTRGPLTACDLHAT